MGMVLQDFSRQTPALLTSPPIVGLSTDDEPEVGSDGGELEAGETWLHEDTGELHYYTGSAWKLTDFNQVFMQRQDRIIELLEQLVAQGSDE